jgi:AbrB family looped-hinge helix DNA binding protein
VSAVTTTVSTKGQVVVPKVVRDQLRWPPGTKLTLEVIGDSLTVRAVRQYPRTIMDQVFGMLKWDGPPVSI